MDEVIELFSQTLLLLEWEKANFHCFHVDIAFFEKRAANLIQMHRIAISMLKSAFGF